MAWSEIAVGGRDDAHVDLDRPRASEPLELAGFQHAQQLRLQVQRQLADLVEKERRAVRDLESPDLPRQRPRERSLLPAEQLALDEPGRQRGAVDAHHDVIVAGTEPVDGLGDPLLARPGLAKHQDTGVRRRHLLDLAEHLLDAPALPGDLTLRPTRADLDLEVVGLGLKPVLQLFDLRVRPHAAPPAPGDAPSRREGQ